MHKRLAALGLTWLWTLASLLGAEAANDPSSITSKHETNGAKTLILDHDGILVRSTNSALPDLEWVPPLDRFDWIQLKSGEWLKGRIKAMQDRELDFDSEEMDDQTFDWKDIRQLRSSHQLDVLMEYGELTTGVVTVTPDEVAVEGETVRRFPRNGLQSLTPSGDRERDFWSGKISLGLTVRAGNTEQVEYNASANLQRRTTVTRLKLDYSGNYSSTSGDETANNHRVTTEFDYWLSRRFYLVIPYAEYFRDPFQNLEHRVTASLGVGYDLIYRSKIKWNITAGPAFQYAWFASTQPGEPAEKGAGALTFGSNLDWDVSKSIELILDYRGQYTSQEVGETTHHAECTLSFDVTRYMDLDLAFTWDRITNPKIGADGIEPEPDDYRLVVRLGVDF